jgi:hypothetical protein
VGEVGRGVEGEAGGEEHGVKQGEGEITALEVMVSP